MQSSIRLGNEHPSIRSLSLSTRQGSAACRLQFFYRAKTKGFRCSFNQNCLLAIRAFVFHGLGTILKHFWLDGKVHYPAEKSVVHLDFARGLFLEQNWFRECRCRHVDSIGVKKLKRADEYKLILSQFVPEIVSIKNEGLCKNRSVRRLDQHCSFYSPPLSCEYIVR